MNNGYKLIEATKRENGLLESYKEKFETLVKKRMDNGIQIIEELKEGREPSKLLVDTNNFLDKELCRLDEVISKMESAEDVSEYKYLDDNFMSSFNGTTPFTEIGEFVYYRTYSRFLEEKQRRESWDETVRRAVEYSIWLEEDYRKKANLPLTESIKERMKKEATELFSNIHSLKQFLSGRTLWIGGTDVSKSYPISNYNCSFLVINSLFDYCELFYLLIIGSGVGFRTLPRDIENLEQVSTAKKLSSKKYNPAEPDSRYERTLFSVDKDKAVIVVGDSKEGWIEALRYYFEVITDANFEGINEIELDYSHVRPKGEKLRRFGGTSSGHKSLEKMFNKIHAVVSKSNGTLNTLDALDIGNIIGENVVSGGVRRTAEMNVSAKEDKSIEEAKANLYTEVDGVWKANEEIIHRQMSNNSIFYEKKPTREELHQDFVNMRYTGERGFINAESARKRKVDFEGVNPCAEILLRDRGLCNLTTVNLFGFVYDGKLDVAGLEHAFRLSARACLRMTLIELELDSWNKVKDEDRLLGCSLTGFFDMVDATGMEKEEQESLLRRLREVAKEEARLYANELGVNEPTLVTTVKPEGTLSQLPTVSSGVHRSHSEYFIRRVRIASHDPIAKVVMDLGYPVFPEVGQTMEDATTLVVEFPVKSPSKRHKGEVSAIEQLETYKMFQECYVDHNTSITVTVKDDEWEAVEEWTWNNWDSVVAVSFLSYSDSFYELLPYEEIDEEEYLRRKESMVPFNKALLDMYEGGEEKALDIGTSDCASGICPIR